MISEAVAAALAPFVIKHGEEAILAAVKKLEHIATKPGEDHIAEANGLVNGARQDDYGSPAQNYADIAMVWSGLLGKKLIAPLTAADAATLMVGMKLARQMNRHKRDNIVDAHGYLLVLAHILEESAVAGA